MWEVAVERWGLRVIAFGLAIFTPARGGAPAKKQAYCGRPTLADRSVTAVNHQNIELNTFHCCKFPAKWMKGHELKKCKLFFSATD